MPFHDYAPDAAGSNVDDGVYAATIKSAKIVTDENGLPKKNENGKCACDVTFDLGEDIEVRRRFSISFGQNRTNGQWAAFAKFLAAVSGLNPSDPRLGMMEPEELIGKRCQVVIEKNEKGYSDVANVLAAKRPTQRLAEMAEAATSGRAAQAQARPKPQPQPVDDEDRFAGLDATEPPIDDFE